MNNSIRIDLHLVCSPKVVLLCYIEIDLVGLGALPGCKHFIRFSTFTLVVLYYGLLQAGQNCIETSIFDLCVIKDSEFLDLFSTEPLVIHQIIHVVWPKHEDVPLVSSIDITLVDT